MPFISLYRWKSCKESLDLGRSKSWEESCPGTCAYEGNRDLKVTGATWAIHKQTQHEGDRHNCFSILYTLEKDLTKLVGIPNKKEKEEKISQLSKIGSKGFLSLEELAKSLYEIEPNLKAEKSCKDPDKIFAYWADWNSVKINDGNKIDFPSKERAQEAYEFLQKKFFKNVAELESYLKGNGFEDAEVTRYYAYVSSNYEKTEVYIELRTSTSRANGFNRFSPCFWMGKI